MSITPPHFGLGMKPNEHGIYDLALTSSSDLFVVKGPEAVAHHVRHRLKTFTGEWFLDLDAGMSWLQDILGRRYNPTLAEAMIKNEVLDTPGVSGINTLTVSYNQDRRDLMIRGMDVSTEYDDQTIWIANVGVST